MKLSSFKSDSILLINPPLIFKRGFRRPSVSSPLGFLYVATALSKSKTVILKDYLGHPEVKIDAYRSTGDVASRDYYLGLSLEGIKNDLEKTLIPEVVGISSSYLSHTFQTIQSIINTIKEISPKTRIIIGGSGLIENIASILKNVDLFYYGEGETRLASILNGEDIEKIDGIKIRKGDNFSPLKRLSYLTVEELDKYAYPDYSLIDLEKYLYFNEKGIHSRFSKTHRSVSFITSRGCPFNCSFCMIKSVQGSKWRPYSMEAISRNLEELKYRYNIEHLHIEDDNFALDIPRFTEIIAKIKSLNMTWDPSNGLYVQHFTEREIRLMKENGCTSIKIAPESGSQRIIDNVINGKPIKLGKVKEIVKWSYSAGLEIMGFLIVGFPQETADDLRKTVDFARELKELYGVKWIISLARPFPGTRLWDYCASNHLLKTTDEIEILGSSLTYNIKHPLFSQDYLNAEIDKIGSEWIELN